jgi:cephalosporin hydroxylase
MSEAEVEQLVRKFNALYCQSRSRTWERTFWLGKQVVKCPLDLWVYQEILFRKRPDWIVETGTRAGGTTHFLATICDLIGSGRIISIDIEDFPKRPEHPRITYLLESSIAPETATVVRDSIAPGDSVMVTLDAAHEKDFVLQELAAYAPLVTRGQYLIVEDTNLNYWSEFGPGPLEAVEEFLETELGSNFRVDREAEQYFMTFNPNGYLVRTSGNPDRLTRARRTSRMGR